MKNNKPKLLKQLFALRDKLKKCERLYISTKDKISKIDEKLTGFYIGDKVLVSSVTVRHEHRRAGLEYLGDKGVVHKVCGCWIEVDLDSGDRVCFHAKDNHLTKIEAKKG